MFRMTLSGATFFYVVGIAALPLLVIPGTYVAADLQKGMIAATLLGVVLCLSALSVALQKQKASLPQSHALFFGLALIMVATISTLLTVSWETSLGGMAMEVGTLASIFLFFFTIIAGMHVSSGRALTLLRVFIGATAISTLLAIAQMILATDAFSVSIAGTWQQHAFLSGAAFVVAYALSIWEENLRYRALLIFSLFVLGAYILLCFIPAVAICVGVLVALIAVDAYRQTGPSTVSISGFLISFVCLVCTLFMHGPLLKNLSLDIRPSFRATELVVAPMLLSDLPHALIGSGPNTFAVIWERNRPTTFNITPYWNTSPRTGLSTALTLVATLGILGILALTLCFMAPLIAMRTVVIRSRSARPELVSAVLLSLFVLLALWMYPIGTPLFLIGAVAIGITERYADLDAFSFDMSSPYHRFPTAIFLMCAGAACLWLPLKQFVAAAYHGRGEITFATHMPEGADFFTKAAHIWSIAPYETEASRAIMVMTMARANQQAAANVFAGPAGVDIISLRNGVFNAVSLSDMSLRSDNDDVEAWLSRARLYIELVPMGYPNASEEAQKALTGARNLAPNRPDVFFANAKLNITLGKKEEAVANLKRALYLKPDYGEAQRLLNQYQ